MPSPSDTRGGRDNNTSSGSGGLLVISGRAPDAEVEGGGEDEAGLEVMYLDTDPADLSGWGRVGGGEIGGGSGELAVPSILHHRGAATAVGESPSHNHCW